MLIKQLYTMGSQSLRDLVELPDGTLHTFLLSCGHKLTAADLTPVQSHLSRDMLLQYLHASPYDGACEQAQMMAFGLTKSPLADARKRAGMTQQALAHASGVNIRQIQKAESGQIDIGNMSVKNVLALADAIGVDVHDIL